MNKEGNNLDKILIEILRKNVDVNYFLIQY